MLKLRFIALLVLLVPTLCFAQEVQVRSRFLADSIKIGEKVPFAVTASYPRKINILFPDSSYSFNPFELESKEFFTTKTKDSLSYDSVIYYISTYEIDSIQMFRMPVYVLHGNDCTAVFGVADSIFLKQYVDHVPDSVSVEQLPLKTNTSYLSVSWLFNYPVAVYIVAGLIVVGAVVWFVFGKRIRRYYKLKRLTKNHTEFLNRYADALNQMESDFNSKKAENALVIWKRYMEGLEQKPFTKYSSKEILRLLNDSNLTTTLRSIDKMVYGGVGSDTNPFQELREVSRSHYDEKLRKLHNE